MRATFSPRPGHKSRKMPRSPWCSDLSVGACGKSNAQLAQSGLITLRVHLAHDAGEGATDVHCPSNRHPSPLNEHPACRPHVAIAWQPGTKSARYGPRRTTRSGVTDGTGRPSGGIRSRQPVLRNAAARPGILIPPYRSCWTASDRCRSRRYAGAPPMPSATCWSAASPSPSTRTRPQSTASCRST